MRFDGRFWGWFGGLKSAVLAGLVAAMPASAAVSLEELKWASGESLLMFFERYKIPASVYFDLRSEDKELASEIISGTSFQLLKDEGGQLAQALIPVSDELQIHLAKDKDGAYKMDFIPIAYTEEEMELSIKIKSSPYQDIAAASGNVALARAFLGAFKGSVNFRALKAGDEVVILYSQRRRDGKLFGMPQIKAAMVKTRGRANYTYSFDDRFYDETGRELENFLLTRPVPNARISSRFNPKRFHPVLKRYRAHLGVDYAAPKGTPVYAAGDGVITHVGTKGGYGKTVIISHSSGYSTLYAHLNGYAKSITRGKKINKGQLIAYVGNTGMSTGPHLHFGLYKDNRAINPESVVKIAKSALNGDAKKQFLALTSALNAKIASSDAAKNAPAEQAMELAMELNI